MRSFVLAWAAAMVAGPVSAEPFGLVIDLLPGHPIYHESEQEAGVVMATLITPDQSNASDLRGLCEELRAAAGLDLQNGEDLLLETIFIVPYKGMAIEGYYLPKINGDGNETLLPGNAIARETLDGIAGRAGIPAHVLDETDVEQELSCELREPIWFLRWEDVRPVGGEDPDTVIEGARQRFMAVHRSIVEHVRGSARSEDPPALGADRLLVSKAASAPGRLPAVTQP
jgi:hypothetical protein